MYDTAEFRRGLKVEVDGEPYEIVDFQHVKMGRGGAFVRTRLRHLATGLVAYYLGSDKRTSYRIALNNIFTALGSVVGSFVGSMLAIPTEFLELSLTFTITYSEKVVIYIFDLKYLDFIFVISSLIGIIATSALRKYRIEATKDEERCYMEMYMNIRRYFRGVFDHVFWIFNHRAGIRRRRSTRAIS